jgi:hypothetical protein
MADQPQNDDERAADRPTFGDLRRWLADSGDPRAVDPTISDAELLPAFPLGALPADVQADERVTAARLPEDADLRQLIAQHPPNDPDLRRRWQEAGVSTDAQPRPGPGDRPEEEGPREPPPDSEPGRPAPQRSGDMP